MERRSDSISVATRPLHRADAARSAPKRRSRGETPSAFTPSTAGHSSLRGGLGNRELAECRRRARIAVPQRCGKSATADAIATLGCIAQRLDVFAALYPVAPPSPVGGARARPFIPDISTTFERGARRVTRRPQSPLCAIDGKVPGAVGATQTSSCREEACRRWRISNGRKWLRRVLQETCYGYAFPSAAHHIPDAHQAHMMFFEKRSFASRVDSHIRSRV